MDCSPHTNKMISLQFSISLCLYLILIQQMVAQKTLSKIDTTNCGKTKGCFRSPGVCKEDKCNFILTWKMDPSQKTVDFEFSARTDHSTPWIALGFSSDTMMAETSVTDCIVNASASNTVVVQSSYNPGYYNKVLSPDSKLGLVTDRSEGAFVNGSLFCRFTRLVELPKPNPSVANLSNPYYLFLGQGPATENGVKLQHSITPITSPRKVSASEIVDIHDGSLVVYHASLMTVAWMLVSSVGVMFSRHYKNVWGLKLCDKKIWFQIHTVAMAVTFLLSIAGAVVVFLDLSASPLVQQNLHPIMGMIVLCLMTLNIILGIFRPSSVSGRRQLFNWAHSLIGNGTHIIAAVTMYFGICALSGRMHVLPWLKWVMVAYIVWRIGIDLVMTVEKYYHREDLRVAYVEMSGTADDIVIESKTLFFKKAILAIYLFVIAGFTVSVLYGIVLPFFN
ncbi:hypothetical protein LSH36_251g01011 [Paralvinella palmiformis]|uniref:Ferric-chelate reductase 1 n=1 Tax=Paralvinella palmiformis TaxID=53620 RepID=A0AAD9JM34_9ANNE|nr:hypothetical protein LSH36_251g01011 [Paralvinella palmiformis]